MILDGKKVRNESLNHYKDIIDSNNLKLKLAIIYVGEHKPSEVYINNKIKYCNMVGIETELIHLDINTTEEQLISLINKLNKDDSVTGMIVQSPIPPQLDFEKCISFIDENKDIDGLTDANFLKLTRNEECLHPCTSKGIMNLLSYYDIDVNGKDVCIIGRGKLVGKPLFYEMINNNATVTLCHSKTKDLKHHTLNADIIVSATGAKHILTSDMIKDGSIVIDAGITVIDGKIYGDVDYDAVKDKCSYITPNPGGVGPMTIATIIENLIKAGMR